MTTVNPIKTDLKVYKNTELLSGITSLSVSETTNESYVYEILTEKPWATVSTEKKYVITLNIFGESPFEEDEIFDLALKINSQKNYYDNCKIMSSDIDYSDGRLTTTLKLISVEGTQ